MLMIHLPLNGDLHNQGLANIEVTNNGATVDNNGKIGKCYSFDGTSKYISLTNPLIDASEISCSVWVKPLTNTSTNEQIINIGTNSGWTNIRFGILQRSINQFVFHVSDGTNQINYACASGTIVLNEWINIICTYKERTLKMYLNGELVKTYSINFDPSFSGISNIGIGAAPNGSEKFTGCINDVRIFSHCLSLKEISELKKLLILHYPLDNNGVGGENIFKKTREVFDNNGSRLSSTTVNNGLIVDSTAPNGKYRSWNVVAENNANRGIYYTYTNSNIALEDLTANEIYTLSFWSRCSKTKNLIISSLVESQTVQKVDGGDIPSSGNIVVDNKWQRHSVTFKWVSTSKITTCFYLHSLDENVTLDIASPKLEKGDKATPWCPNSSDTLYTTLGYNDNIEYDTSGFGNNGTRVGEFSWSTDTPRYLVSTEFSGNSTCVRTSDNNWIARPIEEFTVNLWAYKDDWSTYGGQRLFSCTEGAGFNTEQISSSISFPVNVYTTSERTSRGYTATDYRPLIPLSSLSTGWHMFTFLYTPNRIASYLDGELVDNREYVSYGAFCGDNIPLCIGAEATGNFGMAGGHFVGKISDFRLYYTELSDADILSLYQVSAYIDSQGNTYASSYVEG